MSKLFYDHIVVLEELEIHINESGTTKEEKAELWKIIDNLIQTRVMDFVLTTLPREHHEDFLEKFTLFPHDDRLIDFIKDKSKVDSFEKELAKEIKQLEAEILGKKKKRS